ncbi:MAG TPA: hypothetical protein VHB74_12895 [Devosia sp.]|nr:hypothetical protein [Devosia sp.]
MPEKTAVEDIKTTLLRLARPRMSPKELLRQVRRAHPDASKKDIIRAAFATVITTVDSDIDKALLLQDFALRERGPGED